ncbi:hypothetical protein CEXT_356431 [Caerostris extrusa]|uniref:Homing endonuclease LAGLIDADG domain-containing protein n=1 Tax=Caerostris extrusa TaxID=172846 RepID=A0AAV4XQB5_CAEEX|nr:hypothetical protein CEXT_356431 [Caerostris extrusa]
MNSEKSIMLFDVIADVIYQGYGTITTALSPFGNPFRGVRFSHKSPNEYLDIWKDHKDFKSLNLFNILSRRRELNHPGGLLFRLLELGELAEPKVPRSKFGDDKPVGLKIFSLDSKRKRNAIFRSVNRKHPFISYI